MPYAHGAGHEIRPRQMKNNYGPPTSRRAPVNKLAILYLSFLSNVTPQKKRKSCLSSPTTHDRQVNYIILLLLFGLSL